MTAATKRPSKPVPEPLARLVSPAGFALVLLLFLFLPFLSVSCDVPTMGTLGVDYDGAHLAAGADPDVQVPQGLEGMTEQVPDSRDPGVAVLAIGVAVVLAAGVALPFVPRLGRGWRTRMYGGAALAVLAGALMVVTQVVARAHLTTMLTDYAESLAEGDDPVANVDRAADLVHTEVGFWLSVSCLALIALLSVGLALRRPAALTST